MHAEPRHGIAELERHARAEQKARVAVRIRAVILAMRGRDAPTIEDPSLARRARIGRTSLDQHPDSKRSVK